MNGFRIAAAVALLCAMLSAAVADGPTVPAIEVGELTLPVNQWTKIGEVPPDPLARELEPGRGAFWTFDPASGKFLRYGGYTPSDDNSLWTYDLASRAWANPLKVDYSWPPPADRPGAGAWWCGAYDAKRKVIWLSGGSGLASRTHAELFDDVWKLDPASNTFAPAKSEKFPRFGAPIAYDAKHDVIVRAPAYDGEWASRHNKDQTWVYDPNSNAWQSHPTKEKPRYVGWTVLVYEPNLGKTVYCGHGADGGPMETWTYDGGENKWETLEIAGEPPPGRVWPGYCYDPINKVVLIHGGAGKEGKAYGGYMNRGTGTVLDDTWALDVANRKWTKLSAGAPVPPTLPDQSKGPRYILPIAMDYDTKLNCAVVSAPTFGVWALRYQAGEVKLAEARLAALPAFDVSAAPAEPVRKLPEPNKRLLDLAAGQWVQLGGGPCLGGGEVPWVYDEATGYALKFGGCNNGGTTFASGYGNDLSAYDPATERWIALRWVDPCGPPRPGNGCTRYYAYDPARKVTWFFSGTTGNFLSRSSLGKSGVWFYDGQKDRFDQFPVDGGVKFGTGVASVFDRINNRVVINPKEAWAGGNVVIFDPTAKSWTDTGQRTASTLYTYATFVESLKGMMVVDIPRKSEKEPPGEPKTWLFNVENNAWKDLSPGGTALPTAGRPTLAYDPDNDLVLCIGLTVDKKPKTFVYSVKDNQWKDLAIDAPDLVEMLVYDRRHKVFLGTAAMGRHVHALRAK